MEFLGNSLLELIVQTSTNLPPDVRQEMRFVPVRTLEEALAASLPSVVEATDENGAAVIADAGATAARPVRD